MPKIRKTQERKEIIKTIENAAKVYKDQLVGKTFLYVFDGRYIEVMFKAENFKHLTGVDSSLSAKRFLKLAVHNMLEENQISFSSRHPYALCKKKLGHITEIASFASSESFMLPPEIAIRKGLDKLEQNDPYDYWYFCSNPDCVHHEGFGMDDMYYNHEHIEDSWIIKNN